MRALLSALDASARSLGRDACGDPVIAGNAGHISPDGAGYLLCITTNESPRRWTNIKQRLGFCRVTQDGDDEGCLHLDRLPTSTEAELIREALGIRKRKHFSADALAALKSRLPAAEKRPQTARPFGERGAPLPTMRVAA